MTPTMPPARANPAPRSQSAACLGRRSTSVELGLDMLGDEADGSAFSDHQTSLRISLAPGARAEGNPESMAFGDCALGDEEFDPVGIGGMWEDQLGCAPVDVATASASQADWPTGQTPDPETLVFNPAEVELYADYGAPPAWYLAPEYTVRVAIRRRHLRELMRRSELALARAERQRDDCLWESILALRPRLEADARYRRWLNPILEFERAAAERDGARHCVEAAYSARAAELEEQHRECAQKLAEARQSCQEQAAIMTTREHDRKRVDVRLKRIEIETRNARALTASGNVDQSALVSSFEAQRAELNPQLAECDEQLRLALQELRIRESQVDRLDCGLARLERQRRTLEQRAGKEVESRSGLSRGARDGSQRAWLELGRTVLAERNEKLLDQTTLNELRSHDRTVVRAVSDVRKHALATDAFDHVAEKRGRLMMWLGLLLVAALLAVTKLR
ncbi:hypothetical protein ACFL5O_05025 [Myxococcota bacterium]